MRAYPNILVGVDFTACSAVALRTALRLAGWSAPEPSAVRVVHVIDTLVTVELEEALSELQRDIGASLVRDAEQAWKEFAAGIPGSGRLPIDVRIDNRVQGLLRAVREAGADLLVLGAFGDREPDLGAGTVATGSVRHAVSDVLLVRDSRPEEGGRPFRRVIAAVDFSETSRRALERAVAVAAQEGAALHVLHVFDPPWARLHYRAPTPGVSPAFQKQFTDGLRRRLAEFAEPFMKGVTLAEVSHEVVDFSGHRSGIVEWATRIDADLIVLGVRGRTNLRDLLIGSTAEKVLRDLPCSVLAVKPAQDA